MSDMITPENTKLWLPSALCSHRTVDNQLLSIEWELRYAQAGDALEEMRQNLRLRGHMYSFKRDWIRGQSANTRARNALGRVEAKAAAAAEKYRAARAALATLALFLQKVGWDNKYKVLDKKDDVRGMSVPKNGESEGRRNLSWIWLVEGVGEDEDETVQDCLRVEWCKARARAMRWAEEVELLQEEMRRVLCFLRWQVDWWHQKGTISLSRNEEGPVAYAGRQAQLRKDLADCFEKTWKAHLDPTACIVSTPATHAKLPDLDIPVLSLP